MSKWYDHFKSQSRGFREFTRPYDKTSQRILHMEMGRCCWISARFSYIYRTVSRFVPSQWEAALLGNDVSHWLGANLEYALMYTLLCFVEEHSQYRVVCRHVYGKPRVWFHRSHDATGRARRQNIVHSRRQRRAGRVHRRRILVDDGDKGPCLVYDDVTTWKRFDITGPLWGESTGDRWIPLTKSQWCDVDVSFVVSLNKLLNKQSDLRRYAALATSG